MKKGSKCVKMWQNFDMLLKVLHPLKQKIWHFWKSYTCWSFPAAFPFASLSVKNCTCLCNEREREGEKERKQPWIDREKRYFRSIKVLFTEQFKKEQGNPEETWVQQATKSNDDNVRVFWTSKQRNNTEHRVHTCLFGGGTRREDDKV